MPPTNAMTYTYCTSDDIDAILSVTGSTSRIDDDDSGSASATESGYRTTAIRWSTARCNLFLSAYPQSDLSQSWIVNYWCSIISAHQLCGRRGDPVPDSLREMYDQTMEDLKMVRLGRYQLPDVAMRSAAWPAWSNVRVDTIHAIRRIRVERPISEKRGGQPDYDQSIDRAADIIAPYEAY